MFRSFKSAVILALVGASLAGAAHATDVRISKQYGLPYLSMMVIENQKLIEKKAEAAGLGPVNVQWNVINGSSAQLDALIAGQVDFIGPGIPGLASAWDKTAGTPYEIKGLIALNQLPYVLVTNQPDVKTIADFKPTDKIALPAVKISGHAVALEMAAAKLWGREGFDRLDKLTVSRSHPDGAIALMSGGSEITAHFTSAPHYYTELEKPGIHKITDSYEIMGSPHTSTTLVTSKKYYEANRKIADLIITVFDDARQFIESDPKKAAEIYLEMTKERTPIESIQKMIVDPVLKFDTTPTKVQAQLDFLYQVGRLKRKPNSWRDVFFESIHSRSGS